jgi:hypothetical protein
VKYSRLLILILLYGLLLWGGIVAGDILPLLLDPATDTTNDSATRMMISTTSIVYVIASAIPFVPGAEIGLGLLMVWGTQVLLLVYFCMVAALSISYSFGRFVPESTTVATFDFFGLEKASALARQMAPLSKEKRLEFLIEKAPRRIIPFLLEHRYLALAIALNIPGNTLIGGGGGISFVAGLSGIFSFPAFIVTVLLAVAPLPIIFYFTNGVFKTG